MTKPETIEHAPFIMEDHQSLVRETRRSINAGITSARRKGDNKEAERLEKHLDENGGATGLRIRRRDTVYQKISDPRLLRACDTMRNVAEAMATGQSVIAHAPPPKDPPIEADDMLPAIKNPPRPSDPIDRWRRGVPTMRRVNGRDTPAPCPRTFPPKPVKPVRTMPRQNIAESIYAASRKLQADARRASLWRVWDVALRPLEIERAGLMRSIIIDCISISRACVLAHGDPDSDKKYVPNKRQQSEMRQDLVDTLERAAQYLEGLS
ncbi:MAG: hypothetical protein AAFU81_01655 [Pseudomonadota bacterium]